VQNSQSIGLIKLFWAAADYNPAMGIHSFRQLFFADLTKAPGIAGINGLPSQNLERLKKAPQPLLKEFLEFLYRLWQIPK
jgi:hypothetical protein